eukprot:TRINITY_DN9416_c0_g1_i1.p1 TRINITY_DN9416_c0_g1~~TRINITY_DN9416_c0_g1_i1.p1  ORF type:complete len:115 (+),score=27.53 TRINITY_DN9416_c0_g1_i1:171-515(+)
MLSIIFSAVAIGQNVVTEVPTPVPPTMEPSREPITMAPSYDGLSQGEIVIIVVAIAFGMLFFAALARICFKKENPLMIRDVDDEIGENIVDQHYGVTTNYHQMQPTDSIPQTPF